MSDGIIRLKDFCNMKKLHNIIDNWTKSTGMPVVVKDIDGTFLNVPFENADCENIRYSKEGLCYCQECVDNYDGTFMCHNGILWTAIPIVISDEGLRMGSVLIGVVTDNVNNMGCLYMTADDSSVKRIKTEEEKEAAYELLGDTLSFFIGKSYLIWKAKQNEQDMKRHMMLKEQQYVSVTALLSEEYMSIHYVNLEEDTITFYKLNERFKLLLSGMRYGKDIFSHIMTMYIDRMVEETDKERMYKLTSNRAIKKRLSVERDFIIRYKLKDNDYDEKNIEMHIVRVSEETDNSSVVIGFRCIDKLIKDENDYRKALATANQRAIMQRETVRANAILKRERKRYRDALIAQAEFCYDFDVTNDTMNKTFVTKSGIDMFEVMGITAPVSYTDFCARRSKMLKERLLDIDKEKYWTSKGLLEEYNNGKRNVEIEFFSGLEEKYFRINFLLSKDDSNDHVIAVVVGIDITNQKVAEEKNKKKIIDAYREAERANSAKTRFLSRMSHDIRTPMNGILGMSKIARDSIGTDNNKAIDALDKVDRAGRQLELLLNDVLDMSKLESGKIELSHDIFNINNLITGINEIFAGDMSEKNVLLKGCHFNNIHSDVIGSTIHFHRIVQNIISNAVKYNKTGGSIEVWLDELPIDKGNSVFRLKVEDTGIGMSADYMKQMFEPFSRGVNDAGTTYQGTGLGMAITKELIELMNGSIEVKSRINKGTTFIVKLPFELSDKAAEKQLKSEADMYILKGKHFLLAEDNDINREIAQYILKKARAEVMCAENGKQAVDIFAANPAGTFDAILMDIMMPVMDGYNATHLIRTMKRSDAGRIPIIAMTANAFIEDIKKAKDAGMTAHIAKPLDIDKVAQVIADCIQK